MRFLSTYKAATYVIRAGYFTTEAGRREFHRGITAQFTRHEFDSEAAQRSLGWSDEERELVEDYLRTHSDRYSGRLNIDLAAHPDEQNFGPGGEPVELVGPNCIYTVISPEGAALCGRAVEAGEDYCAEHLAAVNKRVAMAKGKEQAAAARAG